MRLSSRDRFTIKVAAGYAAMAAAWFAVSDSIEALFSSPMSILEIDGALDAGFIAITTVLFIATLRRVPSAAPLLASPRNGLQRFFWYPLAIASALAALWVRQSIDPAQGSQPGLILFLLPITLSAYLGGLGPGLLATGTTAVLSNYFLLFPRLSLTIDSSLAFAQWIALIAIGSLLSIVFETLRRARAQAQNIGALQSAIVASSQDAIYSATPAGTIMSWNEAAEKLFGYTASEAIGQPLSIALLAGREEERNRLDAALARGEPVNLPRTQRRRKDGTIIDISLTVSPVYNAEGQIIGSSRIARDVGDLVRSEAGHRALLATMRTFVEQAPIMIAMLDRNMRYLAASKLWKTEYGGGRDDLTGLYHYDVLTNVTEDWKEINRRALAGETIRNDEDQWIRPDGTIRWLRSVVQPWIDGSGKIGGIIIADDDYTDRRKAENALRESEERFAAVFRDSPVGIAITNLSDGGRFVEANDAWLNIVGFHREEMIGRNGIDLDLWPDLTSRKRIYDALATPFAVVQTDTQLRHKNGTVTDIALTMRQIEIGGHPHGIALGYDYSQRRRLERDLRRTTEQLAAFIDASPVAIVGVDAEDRVVTWSRAATEIFGFAADEVVGKRFLEIVPVPPEDLATLGERAKRRAQGEVTRSLPSRRRRKNGSWARLTVSAGNLVDADGQLTGTILVMEDISEREKLQEQLAQSQKMEAIGQLTGGVAHDFNNLLTVILGNLELIQDQIGHDTHLMHWTEAALEAGRNGADLVHRLLAFSRRQPLEPVQQDVNQRIVRFVPLLKRTLGEAIEVRQTLAASVWQVMIDPAQFDSALLNLAVNARDAMPRGGWIEIKTENVVVDEAYASQNLGLGVGNFVRISVSDSGYGMTPDILARVFEPFFTTKEAGKGTGLGLSMVYGFIKQSGGNAAIYSEVGKGTVVHLLLPRTTPAARSVPSLTHGSPSASLAEPGGETILVVEDDPDVRAVTVEFLKRLGYPVLDTDNTRDALALLDDHPEIALLFTDVILTGGETGVNLATRATQARPGLKVLFASGYTEDALEQSRQINANSLLLHKPFTKAGLSLKVREALDR